jgi:hypothetical protein
MLAGALLASLAALPVWSAAPTGSTASSTWPQSYSVKRDKRAGALMLRTAFYTVEHDPRQGGAIRRIALLHGKADNLLVQPMEAWVEDETGVRFSDRAERAAKVTVRPAGQNEIVTVESVLQGPQGQTSKLRVKSTFEYHWGYVKVHREFLVPTQGIRVRALCPFSTVLAPGLCEYGYREGTTEAEGAPPFSFGSNRWGKLRPGQTNDPSLRIPFVPRSMIFVDPGVEGLEWFVTSDLAQWELALTGRRGQGECRLEPSQAPSGLALSIAVFSKTNETAVLTNGTTFDFYLAVPLLEGRAQKPWVHTSFNRNRGNWVSTEEIQRWAEQGYESVHCHHDGDYYDDGLFWRDGSYPPYADMARYDQVLEECRRVGIHTATYFSNKELHPSTREFQEHGQVWGRMNRKSELQHNFFRDQSEFGVQMCLRSGWLEFLKFSIDRVLKNHPLDGVYYDWNVALFCCNPLHEGKGAAAASAGHWDIDELLDLMEWTRQRVGPKGLVIVHNTTTPMFALENFADKVVATEWGYRKWTDRAPDLTELPVEWSLAGARARGVISYGAIDPNAPRRLHKVFALGALLGGVTPWPASPETFELLPRLKPLGDLEAYRFADWRNPAVTLSDPRCAAAVYSRPGEAYVLVANLDPEPKTVNGALRPEKLPYPLAKPAVATRLPANKAVGAGADSSAGLPLDLRQFLGEGVPLQVPGDGAVVIHVR